MDDPDLMKNKTFGNNDELKALKTCFDRSHTYIRALSHDAIKLYSLLGQLPGGVAIDDLNQLIDKPFWSHRLKLLLKSHLVVEVHEQDANVKYKIPCLFMNKYAESIDSKNDHELTH